MKPKVLFLVETVAGCSCCLWYVLMLKNNSWPCGVNTLHICILSPQCACLHMRSHTLPKRQHVLKPANVAEQFQSSNLWGGKLKPRVYKPRRETGPDSLLEKSQLWDKERTLIFLGGGGSHRFKGSNKVSLKSSIFTFSKCIEFQYLKLFKVCKKSNFKSF